MKWLAFSLICVVAAVLVRLYVHADFAYAHRAVFSINRVAFWLLLIMALLFVTTYFIKRAA